MRECPSCDSDVVHELTCPVRRAEFDELMENVRADFNEWRAKQK